MRSSSGLNALPNNAGRAGIAESVPAPHACWGVVPIARAGDNHAKP